MELRLAENPTTGYRWTFVQNGAPACVVLSDRFERPPGPPGQGGEHAWQIKGAAVGECDIAMQYRRSFQPDAAGRTLSRCMCVSRNDGPAGTVPAGPCARQPWTSRMVQKSLARFCDPSGRRRAW